MRRPRSTGRLSGRSLAPILLPASAARNRLVIPDADRDGGVGILAGRGAGKSRLLGGGLCFQTLMRRGPQVVLDPHGPTVDNLLLQIALLPPEVQGELWSRIVYVDMSGRGERTVPFPLLYRLPGDSLRDIADRFLEALHKIDPALDSASIQGWNALVHVGRPILMILAALGLPATAAAELLRSPEDWDDRLREAVRCFPELEAAVADVRGLPQRQSERLALTRSFLVKIAPFALDPVLRDMFATTEPGIDLSEVVAGRKTVLLDFRGETNLESRRFKTRWVYEWFLAYAKHRGAGRHLPLGFVVDELTELTNQSSAGQDLFARDLDELVNVIGRNYSLHLALCTQGLHQLSPTTQKTLLTMGTQILGVAADIAAAKYLAEQFCAIDPYRVKREENVWGHGPVGPKVLETRPVDMPLEEQILLAAQDLMGLKPFQFLVKTKSSRALTRISTSRLLEGAWTSDHETELDYIRHRLGLQVGVPRSVATPALNVLPTEAYRSVKMEEVLYVAEGPADSRTEQSEEEDWTTPPLG